MYEYDIHPTGKYYPTSSRADKTIAAEGSAVSLDSLMPLSVLVNNKDATTNRGAAISPTSGWGGGIINLSINLKVLLVQLKQKVRV
ncbi:hypothetical protein [Acinetobacter indicus]|uniref:hypothetical protein n=1 Tax=Acinetobacter indicus TaxID=756892 RepID=UPI001315A425|nr:hypothetical protein [Acinetobacter indicus]